MFSCLQILEAFLWFVLITLLYVTLIILTLSVSRLLNLLLRLVAFLLFLNPQCLASISRWITASSSWKRFCLFVCRALSSIMVICMLTAIRLLLTFVMSLYLLQIGRAVQQNAETDLVCRLLLEKKKCRCRNDLGRRLRPGRSTGWKRDPAAGQGSDALARAHVVPVFFFNDTATPEIYSLSLHDALPISFRMQGVEFDNGDMYVDGHKAASDVRDEFVSV